jgi:hypothetical protein
MVRFSGDGSEHSRPALQCFDWLPEAPPNRVIEWRRSPQKQSCSFMPAVYRTDFGHIWSRWAGKLFGSN